MKKILVILLSLCLVHSVYSQNYGKLLYKGIYTETGYGYDDNNNPLNSGFSYSYYIKIYNDVLVVTTTQYGSVKTIDLEYHYIGKNRNQDRIYSDNNHMTMFVVNRNYNITKVYSSDSMMYGSNVRVNSYWTLVKGERYKEYNNRHDADGSSYFSRYGGY